MAAPISDEIAQKIFKALEEQYVPVLKLFKYMPLVWNSIILKSSFNKKKTRFVEIRVMPDQTWKKKLHGTQVHGARVPYKTPLWDNQNVAIGLAQSNLEKKLRGNSSS